MIAENLLDFVLNEKQSIFDEIKEKISPEINLINSIKESFDKGVPLDCRKEPKRLHF